MATNIQPFTFKPDEKFQPDKMQRAVEAINGDFDNHQDQLNALSRDKTGFHDAGAVNDIASIDISDKDNGTFVGYQIDGNDKLAIVYNGRLISIVG